MLYNFDGEVFSSFKLSPRLISLLVNQFNNRAFRYGDGLFESIRWQGGKMLLWEGHLRRLQQGAERLKLRWHTQIDWTKEVSKTLAAANALLPDSAPLPPAWRVRLSIFRKGGGLYTPIEADFSFFIEAIPIENPQAAQYFSYLPALQSYDFYEAYPLPTYSKKDAFYWSSLKSIANAQPYVQAALYKKEKGVEEVLLLNRAGRIAEASSANIFWVEKGILHTPPLSEGCIAGVLRAFLIGQAKKENIAFSEKKCTLQTFEAAEEVFLTNAVSGIRLLKPKKEGQAFFWQRKLEQLWAVMLNSKN